MEMFDLVLMQDNDIFESLADLWTWGSRILSILIILAAGYYGVTAVVKFFQGDQSAGKSILLIVVGVLVWFIILEPMVTNMVANGGSPADALPWSGN